MLKRTPLFDAHQKLGARLVEFGGWEMPVQYSSIVDEHLCVRRAAGIFDICHMGEVLVSGAEAAGFLNETLTNDIHKLVIGQGQYTLLCNERGGVVDDLYAYRIGPYDFLLIINASRIDADVAWLTNRLQPCLHQARAGDAKLEDLSGAMGAVAVQGPRVVEFIGQVFPGASQGGTAVAQATDLKKNQIGGWMFAGHKMWVARTGYTGEDGFEIVAPAEKIDAVWDKLLGAGKPSGLQPCGLGARDTLRTEMGYPLYGHELDENTTPLEAGLGFFVAFDKGGFVGRAVLAEQKVKGVAKKCVAFKMAGNSAPPRPHYPIWAGNQPVGEVVSGTQSPSLKVGIGLGYVPPPFAAPGTALEIEIRGKRAPAIVVPKPVYRKPV